MIENFATQTRLVGNCFGDTEICYVKNKDLLMPNLFTFGDIQLFAVH